MTGDGTLTSTGLVHGTPSYLAPEVARGGESSSASDIFSLGSTLYAAVEGEPPFGADANSIAVLHRVAMGGFRPPRHAGALTGLVMRMLASDPGARPAMAEVASTLERLRTVAETEPATVPLLPDHPDVQTEAAATVAWSATDDEASTRLLPATQVAAAATPASPSAETAGPDLDSADDPTSLLEPTRQMREATASTAVLAEPTASTVTRPSPTRPSPTVPARTVQSPLQDDPARGGWADPAMLPRRRRWLPVLLVILVLALAIAVAAGPLREAILGSGQDRATGAPSPVTTRDGSSASASPSISPQSASAAASTSAASPPPSASAPSSASAQPSAISSARASSAPTALSGPPTAAQLAGAVTDYYRVMPGDTDAGWARLTGGYRTTTARSRSYYDTFWSAIRSVGASDVSATTPNRVVATITYRYRDGRTVVERTSYRLERHGGVLQIADSTVLSSSG